VRAGDTPGKIRIRATSEGYTPAEIVIESKEPAVALLAGQRVQAHQPGVPGLKSALIAAPAAKAAAADPVEIQKLNAEVKQLQLELTIKEQLNQELQQKLGEKR
jgi:beta-galactosidase